MGKVKDLTGQKFGRLTVVKQVAFHVALLIVNFVCYLREVTE